MSDMGDLSEPNKRVTGFVTTPHLTYYAEDRQFPVPSTKGNAMGSGTAEFARHLPFYRCLSTIVLWLRKIPHVTKILRFA
jgi:hypothetical protein